ncbi:MAG: hypothetical protein ACRDHM_06060 [Actinomycetota bacterium]
MTAKVEFVDGEPNGIAAMIGGLIEANLASHPERSKLLKPAIVGIVAEDAHVSLTLRISPGKVTVANGLAPRTDVMVRADSETLTELSSTPLRLGFPDSFTRAGRAVTGKLFSGTLRVQGLLRHAGTVSRLNRLLSVS